MLKKIKGTKRVKWLRINSLPSKFSIVTNKVDWDHLMKVNHLSEEWTENLGGCVILPAEGHVVAGQGPPQPNVLFTILHESVHVWQFIMAYVQEESPGIEQE